MKKHLLYPIVILMIAALTACNMPAAATGTPPLSNNAAQTAIVQTVEARLTAAALTQAAAAPPVTNTPLITNTPLPPTVTATPAPPAATSTPLVLPTATQICDQAQFITDVTIPDGTTFSPGDTFTKTWRIKNIGTCSWTPSYTLFFASGTAMNGPSTIALTGNVNPGQSVDISINLTAPSTPNEYTGYWKLRNASGLAFTSMYVKINVGGGGVFAVNHVNFIVSGACGSFHIKASVATNGAGTVTYHWIRSDGATDTATHDPLVFTAADTQTVATDWFVSASGHFWMDIYIDTPNHQQFGRASFSCP